MTALAFLASVAAIFIAVLAIEDGERELRLQRPAGLLTWLTRGNWPAKVGGALIIVGVGALLRYALLNIDIAPQLKLTAGIVIALALGLGSQFVPAGNAKRAISLALGGAAFGVAYLTAYSAFALFEYLSNPMGLALLGLTSVAAGVFAVTRSALSLAMLSMIGAYLAPAFAVESPGPAVVYGYYLGASVLTLIMVMLRGWRPLIHLSFLFTLAGGVFFAWTAQYYTAAHSSVMLPMLLLLSAVHVAMPIFEKGTSRALWLERLDLIYMLALPVVAALLAVVLSPSRVELSTALLWLGAIWALAAASLKLIWRPGVAAHAVIAFAFAILGIAARFRDLPWELISLAFGVSALAIAAWRVRPVGKLHNILAGLVLLFGAIHVLSVLVALDSGSAVISGVFIERILGAMLLIVAGAICRRIGQALDTLLLAVGIVWALISIGAELIRWDLATLALVVHWTFLLVGASLWIPGRRVRVADRNVVALAIAILGTTWWAAVGTEGAAAWASLIAAPLVLIGMAVRPLTEEAGSEDQRFAPVLMAPAVAAIWAVAAAKSVAPGVELMQLGLTVAAVVAIAALMVGRLVPAERGAWLANALDIFSVAFAAVLAGATLFAIARNPWAVTLEIVLLGGLALVTWIRHSQQQSVNFLTAACMVGFALMLQANLMRFLGPPGILSIADVLQLKWPAVVSLVWAIAGSGLTFWSRKVASRSLWSAGATLLVASAIKLLLVDFGSLGQLANILAVIAAGVVFLLVGWVAPMPPASPNKTEDDESSDGTRRKNAWTVAGVLAAAAVLFYSRNVAHELVDVSFDASRERAAPSIRASVPTRDAPPPERTDNVVGRDNMGGAKVTLAAVEFRARPAEEDGAPPAPAAGVEGLEQLLREGVIRRATPEDIDAWVRATGADRQKALRVETLDSSSGGRFVFRTYVVLRDMTFPERLTGANSATFIVPSGVPRPFGDPGHSIVLETP
jgi:hypothetical protein